MADARLLHIPLVGFAKKCVNVNGFISLHITRFLVLDFCFWYFCKKMMKLP